MNFVHNLSSLVYDPDIEMDTYIKFITTELLKTVTPAFADNNVLW
jgi:hypothetical protein